MRQPIRPHPGSADNPDDFVGRAATTARATADLTAGLNLNLTDPRRMGKSYWMAYFCATTVDFHPVQIDYEGVRTREAFLLATAEKLATFTQLSEQARRTLTGFFDNFDQVEVGPVSITRAARSMSASQLLRETLRSVDRAESDRPILICMDEVPVALRNIAVNESPQAALEILQTLRALRRESTRTRWIVCGSIGFHHVLSHCGATEGDINDLANLPLGPLTDDDAAELARRLFLGIGKDWTDDAPAHLAQLAGNVPFIIQKVAGLLQHSPEQARQLTRARVEEAFDAFVDDRDESRAVTHLLTRLDLYYDDVPAVRALLDRVATAPIRYSDLREESSDPQILVRLIDSLTDDHYLQVAAGEVRWRYDVLRRIWIRRRRLA